MSISKNIYNKDEANTIKEISHFIKNNKITDINYPVYLDYNYNIINNRCGINRLKNNKEFIYMQPCIIQNTDIVNVIMLAASIKHKSHIQVSDLISHYDEKTYDEHYNNFIDNIYKDDYICKQYVSSNLGIELNIQKKSANTKLINEQISTLKLMGINSNYNLEKILQSFTFPYSTKYDEIRDDTFWIHIYDLKIRSKLIGDLPKKIDICYLIHILISPIYVNKYMELFHNISIAYEQDNYISTYVYNYGIIHYILLSGIDNYNKYVDDNKQNIIDNLLPQSNYDNSAYDNIQKINVLINCCSLTPFYEYINIQLKA